MKIFWVHQAKQLIIKLINLSFSYVY